MFIDKKEVIFLDYIDIGEVFLRVFYIFLPTTYYNCI